MLNHSYLFGRRPNIYRFAERQSKSDRGSTVAVADQRLKDVGTFLKAFPSISRNMSLFFNSTPIPHSVPLLLNGYV